MHTLYCLIHGAWHDETCWDPVAALLIRAGHVVVAPRLPIEDPDLQLEDYANHVLAQIEVGMPLVIVGHSMSSDVAAILASKTPVHHALYLCPRLAIFDRPADEPVVFREGAFYGLEEDSLGRSFWPAEEAVKTMYRSLDRATADPLAKRLRPQSDARRLAPSIVHAPDVPSSVIYTTEDEIFEPTWSDWAAEHIMGVKPTVWSGGHFPMIEKPRLLADFLLSVRA